MNEIFTQLLAAHAASYVPFIFILGVMGILMYRAHLDPQTKFNVYDCLIDTTTGKADIKKIGMVMAILTLTWWFVDKAAQGTAGVEEAVAFGGLLGLAEFAGSWIAAKYPGAAKKEGE